jgi:hypothetical protein
MALVFREIEWRGGWDSNPRRLSHLTRFRDEHIQPLCHLPKLSVAQKGGQTQYCATALLTVVTLGRFERPTSSSAGKRSNPLSYRVISNARYSTMNWPRLQMLSLIFRAKAALACGSVVLFFFIV